MYFDVTLVAGHHRGEQYSRIDRTREQYKALEFLNVGNFSYLEIEIFGPSSLPTLSFLYPVSKTITSIHDAQYLKFPKNMQTLREIDP